MRLRALRTACSINAVGPNSLGLNVPEESVRETRPNGHEVRCMPVLLAAFLLGFVAGLRTVTAPAVLWLMRHGTLWAYVLSAAAVFEYAGDLHPKAPPRTGPMGLSARIVSGAFCGWALVSSSGGSSITAALLGALGAIAGAFLGLAARTHAIALIGRIPAALLEDAVAIGGAVLILST
jgi:uncharacterized membrane protein